MVVEEDHIISYVLTVPIPAVSQINLRSSLPASTANINVNSVSTENSVKLLLPQHCAA